MNFKLILNIALHLLQARLKQTIVAAVGVTFGIAMFITLIGFMNGMNDLLDGLMLNRTPHVRLYNEIKPSENQPISYSKKYKNTKLFFVSPIFNTQNFFTPSYNHNVHTQTPKHSTGLSINLVITVKSSFNYGIIL